MTHQRNQWRDFLPSFSYFPFYLELRPTHHCEPEAQIALLASSRHRQPLMSCASSLVTKEMTAGVITEIWDLTKMELVEK